MKFMILGTTGLVGEALSRTLVGDIITVERQDMDVRETKALEKLLKKERVEIVINCTAYVGGIEINRKKPYTMFRKNMEITQSVINACIKSETKELVLFGSNCAYPKDAEQPFKEDNLFFGEPVKTNQGFAAAKIASIQAGKAAHEEHGINIYHPIPCSLYGYRDNYDLKRSHFVAAAIRKITEAVEKGEQNITFWGSGRPCREIMFADDIADAILKMREKKIANEPINIGTGEDTPIKEIIEIISRLVGYKGRISWDRTKPDGAIHKILDNTKIGKLGWKQKYSVDEGLKLTVEYYKKGEGIRK